MTRGSSSRKSVSQKRHPRPWPLPDRIARRSRKVSTEIYREKWGSKDAAKRGSTGGAGSPPSRSRAPWQATPNARSRSPNRSPWSAVLTTLRGSTRRKSDRLAGDSANTGEQRDPGRARRPREKRRLLEVGMSCCARLFRRASLLRSRRGSQGLKSVSGVT